MEKVAKTKAKRGGGKGLSEHGRLVLRLAYSCLHLVVVEARCSTVQAE